MNLQKFYREFSKIKFKLLKDGKIRSVKGGLCPLLSVCNMLYGTEFKNNENDFNSAAGELGIRDEDKWMIIRASDNRQHQYTKQQKSKRIRKNLIKYGNLVEKE